MVTREADWTALPKDTPPHIRRLLDRCLRKDIRTRLRDIGEARVILDEPDPVTALPAASGRARLPWLLTAIFAVCALVFGVLWLWPRPSGASTQGMVRSSIPLPPGTTWPGPGNNATHWTPSPDGRNLAIIAVDTATGKNDCGFARWMPAEAHRIDGAEGASFPFWSPDGQSIGFFTEDKLKRAALSGSSVQTVCQFAPGGSGGGAWGEDDTIVYSQGPNPLMRVNAKGGTPHTITALARGELRHSWPQFLAGGSRLLYLSETTGAADNAIYVQKPGSADRLCVLRNAEGEGTRRLVSAIEIAGPSGAIIQKLFCEVSFWL